MKETSRPNGEAASANITKRMQSWGIGGERPSLMSVGSSTTPTPTSRRSGNGRSQNPPEPPSGPMTASFARGNRTSTL